MLDRGMGLLLASDAAVSARPVLLLSCSAFPLGAFFLAASAGPAFQALFLPFFPPWALSWRRCFILSSFLSRALRAFSSLRAAFIFKRSSRSCCFFFLAADGPMDTAGGLVDESRASG